MMNMYAVGTERSTKRRVVVPDNSVIAETPAPSRRQRSMLESPWL